MNKVKEFTQKVKKKISKFIKDERGSPTLETIIILAIVIFLVSFILWKASENLVQTWANWEEMWDGTSSSEKDAYFLPLIEISTNLIRIYLCWFELLYVCQILYEMVIQSVLVYGIDMLYIVLL